jgi:outer membrane lipoprotein LolB
VTVAVSVAGRLLLASALCMSGCAIPTKNAATSLQAGKTVSTGPYAGRMSLKIDAVDPQALGPQQGQFFSASFELTGNAQAGQLTLISPLGSVLAALNWADSTAQLRANGELRSFKSLDALVLHATGAAIPVASLFSWLAGVEAPVPGWQADLSRLSNGRLVARRLEPLPTAELRLVLEP